MTNKKPWISWIVFLPLWILINSLSWFTFLVLFLMPWGRLGGMAIIALFIGWLQYLVLNKYMEIDSNWIWASLLTYGLFFLAIYLDYLKPTTLSMLFIEIITFGVLGYSQKSVLNSYVDHAWSWVFLSPVAAILGTRVSIGLPYMLFPDVNGSPFIFWVRFGLVYGIITGIVLVLLEESISRKSEKDSIGIE